MTNGGTAVDVPPATASGACEILVGGIARHHDMSHKVGRQANSLGHNKATFKVHLAKALAT